MAMQYTVGIKGTGFVGGALQRYFQSVGVEPLTYDKGKNEGSVESVNQADVLFICVPTPYVEATGGFDLSFVRDAIATISGNKIVVIKSTVLPGTTEAFQTEFPQHKILFNPEFLTQSTADQDMKFPDRQIVGYTKESFNVSGDIMRMLPLSPFERIMPATDAEMVKYFGNTWFSTKVTFANQMFELCEKLGVAYDRVRDAVAADKRIGPSHLEVMHKGYRGYGGACLPKDTRALIQLGEQKGAPQHLLKLVDQLNNDLHTSQGLEVPK